MSDNVIVRWIKLQLDKSSAKATEDGIRGVAQQADDAWKATAKKIAGYLGVAFLLKKIIDFGKAAVAAASESEAGWNDLKGTIDATGVSFDAMSAKLHAASEAFQDATVNDNDAYVTSLTRMVALTGDVGASTNNMGLVANVAAQFFRGDLGPATDLVAKAMNGNVTALQKMGIHAKGAQEALDILATRSMGAAERQTQTFGGQLKQLNNLWDDFVKETGFAIIGADGTGNAIGVLRGAVETLTTWVVRNKKAIGEWVTGGVRFAIDATDVLYRAVTGLANLFQGAFNVSIGVAANGLALFMVAHAKATLAASKFMAQVGGKEASTDLLLFAADIIEGAAAINAWADAAIRAGSAEVNKGIDLLSHPVWSSDQFTTAPKGELPNVAPRTTGPVMPEIGTLPTADFDKLAKAAVDTSEAVTSVGDALTAVNAIRGDSVTMTEAEIEAMGRQYDAANALGEALFASLGSGIGPFARMKARQSYLQATEEAIEAGLAALSIFGAGNAAKLATASASHLALGLSWSALASVNGGGGGGGGAPRVPTASFSPSAGLASSRSSSARAASRTEAPAPQMTVTFVGPGFDSMNPEVQKVVYGAMGQAIERVGPNANVRVVRSRT